MTRHLTIVILLATGCMTDAGDPESGTAEQPVKPGCSPPPTHYCEPFTTYASYPYPQGPFEPGLFSCWFRADADLRIACYGNVAGCCGATNDPLPANHSHDYNEYVNGTWQCSGTVRLKRLCTPNSTAPECEQACN